MVSYLVFIYLFITTSDLIFPFLSFCFVMGLLEIINIDSLLCLAVSDSMPLHVLYVQQKTRAILKANIFLFLFS